MSFRRRSSKYSADYTGCTEKDSTNFSVDISNMDNSFSRNWEPPIDYLDNLGLDKKWPKYVRHHKQTTDSTAASSEMYDTNDKPKTVTSVLKRFAETTAMQGPSNINNSKTWYAKLIWTTLFLGALGGLIFHLYVLCSSYMEFAKQTKVQLGFSSIAFPTVTICNVNPVKFSRLQLARSELRRFVDDIRPERVASSLKERRPPPPPGPGQPRPPPDQRQPQDGNSGPAQNPPPPSNNDQGHIRPRNSDPVQSLSPSNNGQTQTQNTGPNPVQSSPPTSSSSQKLIQGSSPVLVQSTPPTGNDQSQIQPGNPNPVQSSAPPPANDQTQAQPVNPNPVQSSPSPPPANDQSHTQSGNPNPSQSSPQPQDNDQSQTQPGNPNPVQSSPSRPRPNNDQSQTQSGGSNRPQGRPGRVKRFIEDLDFNFTNTRRDYEERNPGKRRLGGRKSNLRELRNEFNYLFSSHDRDTRISMGHDLSDILVSCTFSGVVCNVSQFRLHPTSTYGNCYTLENPDFISYKSGPTDGLEMILFLEIEDYIPTIASGNGVQIQIHETNTWPDPEVEGMAISAAAETNIAMRMMQIDRLSRPYGFCDHGDAFQAKYGRKYTRQTCQLFCVQEMIVSKCRCYDEEKYELQMNLKPETGGEALSACHEVEEVQCMLSVESDWETGAFSCPCYNPCFETSYHMLSNSRSWPSKPYAKMLVQYLCYNKNDSECERYENMEARELSQNFMKVNIYFDDLNYERITEAPSYEDVQFLSDIGGTVGLWVGLSVLSLAEVGQFFIEIARFLFHFTSSQKKKSAQRIHVRGNSLETSSTMDPTRPPSSHPFAEINKKLYFH